MVYINIKDGDSWLEDHQFVYGFKIPDEEITLFIKRDSDYIEDWSDEENDYVTAYINDYTGEEYDEKDIENFNEAYSLNMCKQLFEDAFFKEFTIRDSEPKTLLFFYKEYNIEEYDKNIRLFLKDLCILFSKNEPKIKYSTLEEFKTLEVELDFKHFIDAGFMNFLLYGIRFAKNYTEKKTHEDYRGNLIYDEKRCIVNFIRNDCYHGNLTIKSLNKHFDRRLKERDINWVIINFINKGLLSFNYFLYRDKAIFSTILNQFFKQTV